MKITLGIVTSTRAEWGLLRPLAVAIRDSEKFQLEIYATGTHFCSEYGNTYQEILSQGFSINERVDMLLYPQSAAAISKTMGLTTIGFAEIFSRRKPDILIVLGDRYETLAVCIAAMNEHIPIAHLYGGETTEGAVDEVIRHAITKLSHLHFTSGDVYRRRVIQMGEAPDRVFAVGALAIDNVRAMQLLSVEELSRQLGFDLQEQRYAVATFHPSTMEPGKAIGQLQELLGVLREHLEFKFLITKSNADQEANLINQELDDFGSKNGHVCVVNSLGALKYLSALQSACFMIGNSSSGIYEGPYFKIPTINIGNRQKGRMIPDSVINCEAETASIRNALQKALSDEFADVIAKMKYPWGNGHAAEKILAVLEEWFSTQSNEIIKAFFDISSKDID